MRPGVGGIFAVDRFQAGDHGIHIINDGSTAFVGGADGQTFALGDPSDLIFGNGTDAGDLDRLITDGFDLFHRSCKIGSCFCVIAYRVELGCKLGMFHNDFSPCWLSFLIAGLLYWRAG